MKYLHSGGEWKHNKDSKTTRQTLNRVHQTAESVEVIEGRSTVLVAEDDGDMRRMVAADLWAAGYDVVEVGDGNELLRAIQSGVVRGVTVQPDLIVSDIQMPGSTGLDVLLVLRTSDWAMPVILITAFGDPSIHEEARRLGAAMVLNKPFELVALRLAVRSIVPPVI